MRRVAALVFAALAVVLADPAGAGMPANGFAALAAPTGSAPAPEVQRLALDPQRTRVGFRLDTRWGRRLRGEFAEVDGEVRVHADGRRDVTVRLDSAAVEIVGHPRYTAWARGSDFFDAARHPAIEFGSETYDEALLRDGGPLHGTLTMRGVARPVRFLVEPAECGAPAHACAVVARGTVDRTDFGMDGWRLFVGDDVRFELRVHTLAPGDPG